MLQTEQTDQIQVSQQLHLLAEVMVLEVVLKLVTVIQEDQVAVEMEDVGQALQVIQLVEQVTLHQFRHHKVIQVVMVNHLQVTEVAEEVVLHKLDQMPQDILEKVVLAEQVLQQILQVHL
tara:strand:+ start:149 stop:508 length:360 start_codon:yes stop_codon:yes gene_type:complete